MFAKSTIPRHSNNNTSSNHYTSPSSSSSSSSCSSSSYSKRQSLFYPTKSNSSMSVPRRSSIDSSSRSSLITTSTTSSGSTTTQGTTPPTNSLTTTISHSTTITSSTSSSSINNNNKRHSTWKWFGLSHHNSQSSRNKHNQYRRLFRPRLNTLPNAVLFEIFGSLYHDKGKKSLRALRHTCRRFDVFIAEHFLQIHLELELGWELHHLISNQSKIDRPQRQPCKKANQSLKIVQKNKNFGDTETWSILTIPQLKYFTRWVLTGRLDYIINCIRSITVYLPQREVTMYNLESQKRLKIPFASDGDVFYQIDWITTWLLTNFIPKQCKIMWLELIRAAPSFTSCPAAAHLIRTLPHVDKRVVFGPGKTVLSSKDNTFQCIKTMRLCLENLNLFVRPPLDVETLELCYESQSPKERINSMRLFHFLDKFSRLNCLKLRGLYIETIVQTCWLPSTVRVLDVECHHQPLNYPEPVTFESIHTLTCHSSGQQNPLELVSAPNVNTLNLIGVDIECVDPMPDNVANVQICSERRIHSLKPVIKRLSPAVRSLALSNLAISNPDDVPHLCKLQQLEELTLGFDPMCNDIPVNRFGKYGGEKLRSLVVHWGRQLTYYKILTNRGWIVPTYLRTLDYEESDLLGSALPITVNAYKIDIPLMRSDLNIRPVKPSVH